MKVIKSQADYETTLERIEELMQSDPAPDSELNDELEVLVVLVEEYERRLYPIDPPSPLEALQFRMEQGGLTQRDLVPFIGSRAKVSEVLSGKRPLSLAMLRALHTGLGIPAASLLQDQDRDEQAEAGFDWDRFPIREMTKRDWLPSAEAGGEIIDQLREFLAPILSASDSFAVARRTSHLRAGREMDDYALLAWTARVAQKAGGQEIAGEYRESSLDGHVLRELAQLSRFEQGPQLAVQFLGERGIHLVVEKQLPKTHLDGAAIAIAGKSPTVGLTLRHDRTDNFWFTLMHELAHVMLHFGSSETRFFDDMDVREGEDSKEREADELAGEALIPQAAWESSAVQFVRSPEAVEQLAMDLKIHPAIVAGRIRHERRSYRVLSNFVGAGQVRQWFPDVAW